MYQDMTWLDFTNEIMDINFVNEDIEDIEDE